MKHIVELEEKDILCLIGEYYNIPEEEWNERIEIDIGTISRGYGMGEHLEPYLKARVFLS